ncbi:MAG TPA: V-type ATP synthase subunit E [Candidatus Hydrogenedentes bacterium]|jgi:vacuolar-type H+-ATPase subunit E/Vma4|nr:V-type ATP synthase subunit E [Candidatus Hydrogenedentota bacterium]HPJ98775.1 V-type ATP synthase subunit E [Candidatus Hydrogenedentota bacterium]
MSDEALESGGLQIVESILADADAQASRIIESAESAAADARKQAQMEGERGRDEVLEATRERCAKLRTQELATARIEARRLLVAARESVAERVLAQIEKKLEAVRRSPEMCAKSLRNLAAEAAAAIALPEVVVRIYKDDAAFLSDAFPGEVAADPRAAAAGVSRVILQLDSHDSGGGCIAQSTDGRIVYDNTYKTRMQRKRRELRAMIVEDVINSHG